MSGQPPLALDQTSQGLRVEGGGGVIATCDCQGEEVQEDGNNQVRHHLKWNIHSDGKACLPITDDIPLY